LITAKDYKSTNLPTLKKQYADLIEKGTIPTLHVILVGENPASVIYTRNKKKFIENLGGKCEIINLPETISEKELLENINNISSSPDIHGCFVQMPLPQHLSHLDVGQLIPPSKDVDGFHAENLYHVMTGNFDETTLLPCTPKGVIKLLKEYKVELEGKDVVIIGRSMIVGKPLSLLFTAENSTVTICHSKTKDLIEKTKAANIIVAAIGKANFLNADYLNEKGDQVIVDVGINKDSEGKLCGDVDTESMKNKCHAITPVPGGVGPMTIYCLAENLLVAANNLRNK
jgi:methylenetetrahydrofolate dehydrogenase (NADP+)/methenyltetrahydrofolate cyclohydrolase